MMVSAAPARVAAAIGPVRALDLEVVLAVDDRVEPTWIEGYRQIADRVCVVPFPDAPELLYAWLREQCSGNWILRLDDDEIPAAGLAAELAETLAAADADPIATFMNADALPRRSESRPPAVVTAQAREEITRLSEARTLREDAYRARLTLLDDDLRLVSGEWRTFDVEVENLGPEYWPGGMLAQPQIRVAYRWRGKDGELEERNRTGFGAPLPPGASAIVPVEVLGPDAVGPREIEIDLVHEDARWFQCGIHAVIDVRAPAGDARRDPSALL